MNVNMQLKEKRVCRAYRLFGTIDGNIGMDPVPHDLMWHSIKKNR